MLEASLLSRWRALTPVSLLQVVSVSRKVKWTARSLLRDVARADPPFHALIDVGALITGLNNEDAARILLRYLPADKFDGVVFLDRSDRKMILQRSTGRCLSLETCGVDLHRRFTFYDQVQQRGLA